jgi:NADPH-dependent curcumin reductase CurA
VPVPEDFSMIEIEIGTPRAGEVEVENLLSVDPYMRGRMTVRTDSDVVGFALQRDDDR